MQNKILTMLRSYHMLNPGDKVICAVSGGSDSMALLWCMVLLQEKLNIQVEAAHFNHHLRGEESNRDMLFVRSFCEMHDIPLTIGEGNVVAGKKGLEAAARESRYAFLESLDGKIATAHHAEDNAETVLMHLLRGTGLKGLGGIAPIRGALLRPMLLTTKQEILAFLAENHIPYVEDSTNSSSVFLRNRIRQEVLPIFQAENPQFAVNTSRMAMNLRQDEFYLQQEAAAHQNASVSELRELPPAIRNRVLESLLKESGVKEPEAAHIRQADCLLNSDKPSAASRFPGGVVIGREYDRLCVQPKINDDFCIPVEYERWYDFPEWNQRICLQRATEAICHRDAFTVLLRGQPVLRSRRPGDCIRLSGGTKTVKKLLTDAKIPAWKRGSLPILADDAGVLGILGFGGNLERITDSSQSVLVRMENM